MRNFNGVKRLTIWSFVPLLTMGVAASAQDTGKHVALVIGNNNYSASPLRNAVNDARLMAKSLQTAGFKVIEKEDLGSTGMEEAAADFAGQLGPDDTALFFYAGHGVQIESENFLVPVDFEPANSVIQAKFKCFRLGQLFEELKKRAKRTIVVLDACRSNPVAQAHSLQAGLAQPQLAGKEMFVAFSTGPGQVAADNPNGRDSWFTEALADLIQQPNLTLDDVFTKVKSRVNAETEGRQVPWTQSSLTTTFYFHPPQNAQMASDPAMADKWMLEAQRREQKKEWDQAIALVNQVISRKPGGNLEATARTQLPYLQLRKEARVKYDAAQFDAAALASEQAFQLDPFAIDAAFDAIDDYLLSDRLADAVRLMALVRVRGTSAAVEKADLMLKELAVAYPDANTIEAAQIPPPPPIQELFKNVQFGVPDWTASRAVTTDSPMVLARWSKALETAYPPPAEPTAAPVLDASAQSATAAAEVFHVEVTAADKETRDLAIRKVGDQEGPRGSLMLMGASPDTRVLANGTTVAEQLPATIKLPPGKYTIRTLDHGQVGLDQAVEIVAFQTKTVVIPAKK